MGKLAGFGTKPVRPPAPSKEEHQQIVTFNTTQNSALVAWFLQTHKVTPRARQDVKRTEIATSSPPPLYRIQALESARTSTQVLANYKKCKGETARDRNSIKEDRSKTRRECDRAKKISMGSPAQVKAIASTLVTDILELGSDGDEGVEVVDTSRSDTPT